MDNKQMHMAAQAMLDANQDIDVIYGVSDGQMFFSPEEAAEAAKKMADAVITPFYRDDAVRKMAQQYRSLQQVVFATDYLKLRRLGSKPFVYAEYNTYAEKMNMEAIPENLFNFIASKVYASRRPVAAGQKDKIFMWNHGIVEAVFMRRYPQGVIWQVGDNLVFTCPTHTELMSGTYQQIFAPMLGEPVKRRKV